MSPLRLVLIIKCDCGVASSGLTSLPHASMHKVGLSNSFCPSFHLSVSLSVLVPKILKNEGPAMAFRDSTKTKSYQQVKTVIFSYFPILGLLPLPRLTSHVFSLIDGTCPEEVRTQWSHKCAFQSQNAGNRNTLQEWPWWSSVATSHCSTGTFIN